jgi:tetratricopeptide (TPR) repeat protein
MSGRSDSLQDGLRLNNEGKTAEAFVVFEKLALSDTSGFNAKKYAGFAALRLKEYEKALAYFEQLEIYSGFYSNPSLLMQAVTLMERNQPGDTAKAKILLQKVVANDLEGKELAQEWLKNVINRL